LVLTIFAGDVAGNVKVPFLYDVEAQTRMLFSVPLLIAAELLVHLRMRRLAEQFIERQIVR